MLLLFLCHKQILHALVMVYCAVTMRDETASSTDQSMSMPIERPSPCISALLFFAGTLIFSNTLLVWVSIGDGSRSLTDTDFVASFFFLCARCLSRATAILRRRMSTRVRNTSRKGKPLFPKSVLPPLLNLPDAFHGVDCGLYQFTIVADGYISTFLEVNRGVLFAKG